MGSNVNLCGTQLDNPVIPASGTFGFGYEFAELYDINILGTFSFKGTTREARFGNPTPRIAECPAGLINAGSKGWIPSTPPASGSVPIISAILTISDSRKSMILYRKRT